MTERRRAERRRAEIDWKFYKKVFWLALPIALQSLITIGVNMLDTIMVGNLGEMSLSAVSLANQFIGVYQIFCMGLEWEHLFLYPVTGECRKQNR